MLGRVAVPPEDGSIHREWGRGGRALTFGPPAFTFALLLAAYAVGHAALRVWISPILNIDDAREAIFTQSLAWGYQPRQPPLYTWLAWGTVRLAGPGVASLTGLKYAVLALAYAFMYATARRILREARLAPLAVFSLLLLLPIGWFVHDDLTQSVAVLAAAAATVYTLICLEAVPTAGRYTWLGVVAALGTLSKLTYLVFGVALIAAALSIARYRRRLLDARGFLALGVMGILLVPYLSWLARHGDELARFYAQVAPGTTRSFAAGAVEGLGAVLRVLVYYAGPLGLVFLALFPGVYRVRREPVGQDDAPGQLVERTLLWGLALLIAGALLNLLGQLKFRWAIPLFFLLPLYGCWRADRLAHDASWRSQRLRIYAGMLFLTEGLIVAGILLQVHMGARVGVPSRLNMPYDAVARSLAATGFRQGTIVAGPGPLGGNLRIAFPHARVASLETPGYLAPAPASGGECLVVWDRGSGDAVPEELRSWLEARLAVELPVTLSVAGVTASYRHTPASVYRAFYVHLPRGAGLCR